ncbi:hypothetical protein MALU111345_21005 [Marinicrinis lubricantis]
MILKKAIICSSIFVILFLCAWVLNDRMIQHRYSHLQIRSVHEIQILHNESIKPFKPREYAKIIRSLKKE